MEWMAEVAWAAAVAILLIRYEWKLHRQATAIRELAKASRDVLLGLLKQMAERAKRQEAQITANDVILGRAKLRDLKAAQESEKIEDGTVRPVKAPPTDGDDDGETETEEGGALETHADSSDSRTE